MGYWLETCAVTNLPINGGEECVMLVYPYGGLTDSFQMMDFKIFESPFNTDFPLIYKGKYNSYGYMDDAAPLKKNKGPADYPIIFIKLDVWNNVILKYKNNENFKEVCKYFRKLKTFEFKSLEKEYLTIKYYMRSIRKSFFSGLCMRGHQHNETDVYKELAKMTNKEIKKIDKLHESYRQS